MAYHVEVRASRRHARLFNLGAEELQQRIVHPWQTGRPLSLGDRQWERRESRLTILEGPELEGVDLAYGQGWNHAERTASDVTATVLSGGIASTVAILTADEGAARAAAALLATLGMRTVAWPQVRRALVAWLTQPELVADLGVAAVVAVHTEDAPPEWLFDAGLALGALGRRTVLLTTAGAVPLALAELPWLPLDPESAPARDALAERLSEAGCGVAAR